MTEAASFAIQILPNRLRHDSEPIFTAPWQAKIFVFILLLIERGDLYWSEFRDQLIEEIAGNRSAENEAENYYLAWLQAAERVLQKKKLITGTDIETQITTMLSANDVSAR